MTRRSKKQLPPLEGTPWPGGPVMMWIGVAVFLSSMAAGLVRSFATRHGLPRVGVEYKTELNEIVRERGGVAALPQVRSAARIDFDNEMAVTGLLDSARQAGRNDDIVWALSVLVRLRPEDGQVRNDLALALLIQGRVIEAQPHAAFAVRLAPDSATAHCNLGAALLGLGHKQQAATAYRRALELDPASEPARLALEFPLRGF